MLQKIISAVVVLMLSSFVFAGSMGEKGCKAGVGTPCDMRFWEFGINALYLKPTYSQNLNYVSTTTLPLQPMDADWSWGFQLSGSYYFNSGNDIVVNWSHYQELNQAGTYTGNYFLTGFGNLPATYQLALANRYDAQNILMGQWIHFDPLKHAHFYGGMQYADLRVDMSNNYAVPAAVRTFTTGGVFTVTNTDFKGFGPSFGVDYIYGFSPAFRLVANTAGALLYGTSRYHFGTVYGSGFVPTSTYGSQKEVVPELEARLGASYIYNLLAGLLNIEGGYRAVNYFSPLQAQPVAGGTPLYSDFGLFGPYFGIRWLGDA